MKLTSFQTFHLKGIAKGLPVVLELSHEKHMVSGKVILEWGTITEIDGQPIDPDKTYQWHYPVQMYRNQYRRLRKAYVSLGMEGVRHYLYKVDQIIKTHNNGQALGAFTALQGFLNQEG